MKILPQTEKSARRAAVVVRVLGSVGLVLAAIVALVGIAMYAVGKIMDDAMPHTGPASWGGVQAAAGVALVSLGMVLGVRTSVFLFNTALLAAAVGSAMLGVAYAGTPMLLIVFAILAVVSAALFLLAFLCSVRAWPVFGAIVVPSRPRVKRLKSVLLYWVCLSIVTAGVLALFWHVLRIPWPLTAGFLGVTAVVEIGGGWIAARMQSRLGTGEGEQSE